MTFSTAAHPASEHVTTGREPQHRRHPLPPPPPPPPRREKQLARAACSWWMVMWASCQLHPGNPAERNIVACRRRAAPSSGPQPEGRPTTETSRRRRRSTGFSPQPGPGPVPGGASRRGSSAWGTQERRPRARAVGRRGLRWYPTDSSWTARTWRCCTSRTRAETGRSSSWEAGSWLAGGLDGKSWARRKKLMSKDKTILLSHTSWVSSELINGEPPSPLPPPSSPRIPTPQAALHPIVPLHFQTANYYYPSHGRSGVFVNLLHLLGFGTFTCTPAVQDEQEPESRMTVGACVGENKHALMMLIVSFSSPWSNISLVSIAIQNSTSRTV